MIQALRKRKRRVHIGPGDDGRRMSLDQFDHAVGQEGYLYELNKGVIEVSDIPGLAHGRQVQELRKQLVAHQLKHPEAINYLAEGSSAKLLMAPSNSERHPDLLLYLSDAPHSQDPWSLWIPEIVIEVISESSRKRDYEDKPGEYLEFGVREYWIVDSRKSQLTANIRWRGIWKPRVVKGSQKYTTPLLPGFSLDLKKVFAAAK